MLGMNGWEMVVLVVLAVVVLGPERMPEYAAKLARLVVRVRDMANDAKGQIKDQMGPEFEDINWRQYDPRQYDPRRIVREALLEPSPGATAVGATAVGTAAAAGATGMSAQDADDDAAAHAVPTRSTSYDPDLAVPYDIEAT